MDRLMQIGPFARIGLTLLVAAAVYFALWNTLEWPVRLVVAWCGGATFFLIQTASLFAQLDAEGVRERCQQRVTEGHTPMLVGGVLVVFVSIGTVISLLDNVQAHSRFYTLHLGSSIAAIGASWLILQTMYAIYYARLFYQGPPRRMGPPVTGGLRFPTDAPPDYWDFMYFSCTIAMCYSVSDIAVTSKFIRLVTLSQALICFFYYTVIIGLVMNVMSTAF
jgi:uncharacterized membrane protein